MKISLPYIVCAFCLVGLFACRQGEMELLLTELDHTIENKAVYTERFNGRADSLRRALRDAGDDTRRWQTANRLFDAYITYNIDTAARYVALMYDLAERTAAGI